MNKYEFLGRSPELVAQRRVTLDRYANLAQISQAMVHLSVAISALVVLDQVRKLEKRSPQKSPATTLARTARNFQTLLGTDVKKGYGTYGQWTFGLAWTAWLAYLCVAETTPDYMHLTKRFGLIAASQLPIHYLLSATRQLKHSYRLNMSLHKVTGKIIIAFFALHISFYGYAFVRFGLFWDNIKKPFIVVALISAGVFFVIGFTSTQSFRRRSYWWFYKIPIVGSAVVLPLLWFHVEHIRIYLLESAAVLLLNAGYRMLREKSKAR